MLITVRNFAWQQHLAGQQFQSLLSIRILLRNRGDRLNKITAILIAFVLELFGDALGALSEIFPLIKVFLGIFIIRFGFTDEDIYENIESDNTKNKIIGRIEQAFCMIFGIYLILTGIKGIFS